MIFCTPQIISFFKKGQDLFDGLASRIPFVLLVLTIRISSKSLFTIPNPPDCIVPSLLTLSLSSETRASE